MNEQNFDNAYYYSANPDVRQAVIAGKFTSGYDHYIKFGQYEGRLGRIITQPETPSTPSQYSILTDPDSSLRSRSGVRNGVYCIDNEISPIGFDGVEGLDWENIWNSN